LYVPNTKKKLKKILEIAYQGSTEGTINSLLGAINMGLKAVN